ncbi:MAG: hypothetical protein HYT62_04910 [Candidatus Yanofskybacteria bacterium]|nr:hypothetical protein [Candidatus Yanofskybacteria bacterium]
MFNSLSESEKNKEPQSGNEVFTEEVINRRLGDLQFAFKAHILALPEGERRDRLNELWDQLVDIRIKIEKTLE